DRRRPAAARALQHDQPSGRRRRQPEPRRHLLPQRADLLQRRRRVAGRRAARAAADARRLSVPGSGREPERPAARPRADRHQRRARVPPQGAARRGRTIMTRRLEAAAVEAFTAELRHNVPLILAALDASEQHPIDPLPAQEAYRLIHALKGAASMVGLAALSHLLNLAEERLERSVDAGTPLPPDSVALLRASLG